MNPYFQLGMQSHSKYDFKKAIEYYQQALIIEPTSFEVLINLANVYMATGDFNKSEMFYKKTEKLYPNEITYCNLGNLYSEQYKLHDALKYFKKALEVDPNHQRAYSSIAKVYFKLNKINESLAAYEKALELDPKDHLTRTNYCYPLLSSGKYEQGWKEHEARFPARVYGPTYGVGWNFWTGQDLTGKSLFVYPESGYGDIIQFARYVPLIKEKFGNCTVLVGCRPELLSLFEKTIKNVDLITMQEYKTDYQVPSMSLAYIFKSTVDTIPNNPYINIEHTPIDIIQNQPGLKVGLVWGGNTFPDNPSFAEMNKKRSVKLEQFAPLSKINGVSLFSLQMPDNPASKQLKTAPFKIIDAMKNIKDFHDTAKVITNLDLLISVDTSIIHLAGAMGKPVWNISRFDTCWRWLLNRSDTPWYPSMKIFRQPEPGDWKSVIKSVTDDLKNLIKEKENAKNN